MRSLRAIGSGTRCRCGDLGRSVPELYARVQMVGTISVRERGGGANLYVYKILACTIQGELFQVLTANAAVAALRIDAFLVLDRGFGG